jgi:hypothetical protein
LGGGSISKSFLCLVNQLLDCSTFSSAYYSENFQPQVFPRNRILDEDLTDFQGTLCNTPEVPLQTGNYARRITRAKRHYAPVRLLRNIWPFALCFVKAESVPPTNLSVYRIMFDGILHNCYRVMRIKVRIVGDTKLLNKQKRCRYIIWK